MPHLQITLADGRMRSHQLGDVPVVLGREPSCDIPLQDLSASRRHVIIRYENGGYLFEDLGSKNGTLLNEVSVRSGRLSSGDEIMIGAVRAVFREEEPASSVSVVIQDAPTNYRSTTYGSSDTALQLSHRRLEILYELNERLTGLRDRDTLLSDAMDVCFEMLRFERGAIGIKQGKGQLVDWPVVRNLRGAEGELTVSRTILRQALTEGQRVIVNDTGDAPIDPTVSMVQLGIRSAMCVPLLCGGNNLGVIYGDQIARGTTYTKEEIDFLAGIARLVTIGLVNAQLLEEQKLKIQLEGEIAMAREIQTGLFPRALPARDDIKIATRNDPGKHVSGDYYDTIEFADGRVAFLIADVTGEGVAASLLMANLQAAVRVTLDGREPLGPLLKRWNRLVYDNTDASRFVTTLVGVIDPASRRLELASAGHHLPVVVPAGGKCRALEMEPDFPLGVMEEADYSSRVFEIDPGPVTLFCYTDGVIEAMNENLEQYLASGLYATLESLPDIAPETVIDSVRKAVLHHAGSQAQSDDITMVAVHLP